MGCDKLFGGDIFVFGGDFRHVYLSDYRYSICQVDRQQTHLAGIIHVRIKAIGSVSTLVHERPSACYSESSNHCINVQQEYGCRQGACCSESSSHCIDAQQEYGCR